MLLPALCLPLLLAPGTPQDAEDTRPDREVLVPPVLVTAVEAELVVDGAVARVTQHVTLMNPAAEERPFEMLFPLGADAAVTGLALHGDGGEIQGELFEAGEARRIFQRMAESPDFDPALLEHYGESLFRASVLAVPPGGTKVVTLRYSRLVDAKGDLLRGHLPLTAWRRSAGPFHLAVRVEIVSRHPVGALYSPTHDVEDGESWVTWEEGEQVLHRAFTVTQDACTGDSDFEVYYKARPDGARFDVTVLSERPDPGQDGYFLAVVHGVPDATLRPQPRNVVFVLDRSGSMEGEKFEQARAALLYLARELRPEDRFALVDYAKETARFRPALVGPTSRDLADFEQYVAELAPDGGTNIEAALLDALGMFAAGSGGGVLNQVVFLTDGLPTEGEQDTRRLATLVEEHNVGAARIVAFGLGYDVNSALLDRLATGSRGLSEYVLPTDDIAQAVPGFLERMRAPLLLDATLSVEGVAVDDVYPREVGDLYGGHKLVLAGRYTGGGRASVVLNGSRDGSTLSFEFPAELATDSSRSDRDAVARLWATRKIGFLIDDLRLNGEDPAKIEEVVRLGTRFGVLTEYTAFLAEEDTDLFALSENIESCTALVDERAQIVSGVQGVAQACNSKEWQRATCAATPQNSWYDASGRRVTVGGVTCTSGRTFFKRGETWQDSRLAKADVDREVAIGSGEFFALLDRHPWLGSCVARTGDVTVGVEEHVVRLR